MCQFKKYLYFNNFLAIIVALLLFAPFVAFSQPMESADPIVAEQKAVEQKISLNKASIKELRKLKGIGKKKAQAIIAYREQHGGFSSLDELKKIKGLGKKVLKENIDHLTL